MKKCKAKMLDSDTKNEHRKVSYENAHVPYFLEKYFPSILTEKLGRHSLKKGAFIFGKVGAY